MGAESLFDHLTVLALSFELSLTENKLRLQTAHLEGQLLLGLTRAKEARVILREGLLQHEQ
jgi:hypothetical protein